ncbi:MAG: hypothetical protein CFH41_00885 [Alphaproteobacteria bacterium MarineAlpha11_Bin1]|nr:MAG: hypothetical protein CFH41_00885 [Alphaproteobacteria bacterium MarineAlpha11_Bin1]|tara:strand:+ start:1140 stop:1619 length:480 start_codon:yes stop_codon:yes gene_type:complete
MTRTFAVLACATMLFSAPVIVNAAGSSDDNETASEASVNDSYRLAVKAVNAKHYPKAINLLNYVIEKKPNHPDALNYLGYSHRKSGDFARAVSYYKKALSLDPKHLGANEYLGQAYVELDNLEAAKTQLNKLEKICGTNCDEFKSLKLSLDASIEKKSK